MRASDDGSCAPDVVEAVRAETLERFGPPRATHLFDASRADPPAPLPRVEVLVWPADDEVEIATFATLGMSLRPMPGCGRRAEVHFAVRAALSPAQEAQSARFLAHVAGYPFDHGRALDWFHLLSSPGEIPGFPSCSAVLLHPRFVPDGWDNVRHGEHEVRLLNVVPITQAERALVKGEGALALTRRWAERGIDLFRDRAADTIDGESRPVEAATGDLAAVERILASIPSSDWEALEEGLARVPRPYRPDLYRVY